MKKKVVSCIIVKNAEKTIERCLDSLMIFSNTIIMVDTGSSDRTLRLVENIKYGTKVSLWNYKWCDDFSAARNYAFDKGRALAPDYLFWMDADDYIEEEQAILLRDRIDELQDDIYTVILPYIYSKNQHGASVCTLMRERLLLVEYEFPTWKDPVHEYIDGVYGRKHIVWDDIYIHHNRQVSSTSNRNTKIYEKWLADNKQLTPRMKFYYANELMHSNNAKAIKMYKEVIEEGKLWIEDHFKAHLHIANYYKIIRKFNEALDWYFRALRVDARFAEPFFNIGDIYMEEGKFQEALDFFKMALLKHKPDNVFLSNDESQTTYLSKIKIYECYVHLKKWDKAIKYCKMAIEDLPDAVSLKQDLQLMKDNRNQMYYNAWKDVPIRLDIGAGGLSKRGIISCDYYDDNSTLYFPMHDIPFPSKTVDMIICEHALEHSIHYMDALLEFWRVLKPGGKLYLEVPDFDECIRLYNESKTYEETEWYKKTVYGRHYTGGEIDMGQIHYIGFDIRQLRLALGGLDFVILNHFTRDHCSTPSLYIEAVKKIKIFWMADEKDIDNASVRLRKLNIHKDIVENEITIGSYLFQDLEVPIQNKADIVVLTSFDENVKEYIDKYHQLGIKTVYEHNENINGFPGVNEVLSKVSHISVCSERLKTLTEAINNNIVVIPDMWE